MFFSIKQSMMEEFPPGFVVNTETAIGSNVLNHLINKVRNQPGFSLFDYEKVKGSRHILAAINNTVRRKQYNDLRAKSIETEFILFLSGERQIIKAQKDIGLSEKTRKIGIIIWKIHDAEHILKEIVNIISKEGMILNVHKIDYSEDNGLEEDLAIEKTTMSNLK